MSVKLKQISLSRQVRRGCCGTPPKVLTHYLDACDQRAQDLSREQARQLYISVFNVIVEVVCDDLIAKCWRGWCLDNVYKPLAMLRVLSVSVNEKKELASLEAQMRLLSSYFLR